MSSVDGAQKNPKKIKTKFAITAILKQFTKTTSLHGFKFITHEGLLKFIFVFNQL